MIDYSYLPDIILIIISGSACLYCGLLNRRLRKLQDLKSGIGASIVSLTDAIAQTNKAANDAQTSTLQTVETLRHLLAKAESAVPKVEAMTVDLSRCAETAQTQRKLLDAHIENTLKPSIIKAQTTATDLLQAVAGIDQYVDRVKRDSANREDDAIRSVAPIGPAGSDKLKVVSS